MSDYPKFSDLVGRTLSHVENVRDEEIRFATVEGESYRLYHDQDCCESVRVEEIVGDLSDLVGSPITMADEATSENVTPEGMKEPEYRDDSFTWTFYRLATVKGYVTIRFYGSSNGYYSERVDFVKS